MVFSRRDSSRVTATCTRTVEASMTMMKNVRSSNNGIMAPLYRRSSTLAGALLLSIGLHVALGFSTRPAAQQSSSLAPLKAATALPLDTIVPPTPLEAEESKVGVLLLNLGGPETSDDVEGGSFSLLSYLFLLARLFLLQRKIKHPELTFSALPLFSLLKASCTISLPTPTLFVFPDLLHHFSLSLHYSSPNAVLQNHAPPTNPLVAAHLF